TRLAGIWWGVGCQVVGRGAAEIESGIRLALGLLWTEYIADEVVFRGAVERCFRASSAGRASSIRDHLVGEIALGEATRFALRLYRQIKEDPAVLVALQD